MFIMCSAYGLNAFTPNFFVRLHSANSLIVWGDENTEIRFGGAGQAKKLSEYPSYATDHTHNERPAFVTAYPNGWGHAFIPTAGIVFPVTLEIFYPEGTKNAGIRANGGSISGRLPDSLERWTALFVNHIDTCPNPNWNAAGFSSAGISNWDSVKGGLKHLFLIDYKALSTRLGFQDVDDVFDIRGNEVLETLLSFGLGSSPAQMGLSAAAQLKMLVEDTNGLLINGSIDTYLDGLNLSGLELGIAFPSSVGDTQLSRDNSATLLAELAEAGAGPAAPGAQVAPGFFNPENAYAATLTEAGYQLINGNN